MKIDPFRSLPNMTASCPIGGGWNIFVKGNPIKGGVSGTFSGPIWGGTGGITLNKNGGNGGWAASGTLSWSF